MASIDELELTTRAYNVLKRAGIDTVEKLDGIPDSELLKIRNLNQKCLKDIKEQLKKYKVGKHYECKYCDYTRGVPYPGEPDFLVCGRCGAEWEDCKILVEDEDYDDDEFRI